MERDERVLACFQQEIADITKAKIASIKQELDAVQMRMEQEVQEESEARAQQWFEQEAAELRVQHAVEMSRLHDETHHHLLKEREVMVNALFDQVKERLCAFRKSGEYKTLLLEKLKRYTKEYKNIKMQIGSFDESLIKELQLDTDVPYEVVSDIKLGGFRLVLSDPARIIEETYDSALEEAKEAFLRTSGLTIS